MNTRERVLRCRILEKMHAHPECAKRLGLVEGVKENAYLDICDTGDFTLCGADRSGGAADLGDS